MLSPSRIGALMSEGTQKWGVGSASFDKPDLADAALACQGMPEDAWIIYRWVFVHGDTAEDWRSRDARQAAGILALRCLKLTAQDSRTVSDELALRMVVCALRDLRGGFATAQGRGLSARARACGIDPRHWRRWSDLYEALYQAGADLLAQAYQAIRYNQMPR